MYRKNTKNRMKLHRHSTCVSIVQLLLILLCCSPNFAPLVVKSQNIDPNVRVDVEGAAEQAKFEELEREVFDDYVTCSVRLNLDSSSMPENYKLPTLELLAMNTGYKRPQHEEQFNYRICKFGEETADFLCEVSVPVTSFSSFRLIFSGLADNSVEIEPMYYGFETTEKIEQDCQNLEFKLRKTSDDDLVIAGQTSKYPLQMLQGQILNVKDDSAAQDVALFYNRVEVGFTDSDGQFELNVPIEPNLLNQTIFLTA